MKKPIRKAAAFILLAAITAGLATGCGGSKAASNMVAETTAAAAMDYARNEGSAYQVPGVNAEMAENPAMEAEAAGLTSTNTVQPVASNRKLIRNVNLSVETTSFDTLTANLTAAVTGFGGYVEQSDISGNSVSSSYSGNRYAYLTVRVPSDKLDIFITQVEEQGNITNKSETTQDVTLQYSDIESRKKSLTIEQDRIWALLEKADTLEAVIALESRLSEIRYQLESFESQLRTYDNQVDYSTVYISISEVKVFTPTTPDSVMTRIQKGFTRNLNNVANGLVDFFVWLVSSLPVLILLAIIAALAFLLVRFVNRRRPRREKRPKRYDEESFWHRKPSVQTKNQPVPPAPPTQPMNSPSPQTVTKAEADITAQADRKEQALNAPQTKEQQDQQNKQSQQ